MAMIATFIRTDAHADILDEEEGAAKIIQKNARTRKHKKLSPENRVKRVRAAIAIQRCWRGYLSRKNSSRRNSGVRGPNQGINKALELFMPVQTQPEPQLSFRLRVWLFMEDGESTRPPPPRADLIWLRVN